MVTRIRHLLRSKGIPGKIVTDSPYAYNEEQLDSDVQVIIATLEQNNLELTDVLERVYLRLKEK